MARRSTKARDFQRHDVGQQKAREIQKTRVFQRGDVGRQKRGKSKKRGKFHRGHVGRQKAREIQKRGDSSDVAKTNEKPGNLGIRRRSTTREPEGTTKIERDRRTIDPGSNDAIDEVDNSRQYL